MLVFLINIGSLRRMLLRAGLVLLVASVFYAVVERRCEALFAQPVEHAFFRDTKWAAERSPEHGKLWAAFSSVLVHATSHADRWVYASMATGLLLCVAGFARRSKPDAPPAAGGGTQPVA